MTDIIEQAARVIDRATSYTGSALSTDAQQAAQALADAGLLRDGPLFPINDDPEVWEKYRQAYEDAELLREPARTVPTRPRVKWQPKPRVEPDKTPVEARATCPHCGTTTITKFTAPGPIPQPLHKCNCTPPGK